MHTDMLDKRVFLNTLFSVSILLYCDPWPLRLYLLQTFAISQSLRL